MKKNRMKFFSKLFGLAALCGLFALPFFIKKESNVQSIKAVENEQSIGGFVFPQTTFSYTGGNPSNQSSMHHDCTLTFKQNLNIISFYDDDPNSSNYQNNVLRYTFTSYFSFTSEYNGNDYTPSLNITTPMPVITTYDTVGTSLPSTSMFMQISNAQQANTTTGKAHFKNDYIFMNGNTTVQSFTVSIYFNLENPSVYNSRARASNYINSQPISLPFYTVSDMDLYQQAYEEGYQIGYQEGYDYGNNVGYQDGYNVGYSTGYGAGQSLGYEQGYQDGVASQQVLIENSYSSGYTDGYNEGLSADSTVVSIFSGILQVALVPINFFLAIFNFEILGINLSAFIKALFTVVITVIVLKTVIGGGTNDK